MVGDPQPSHFSAAPGFGDDAFPHRQWPERTRFQLGSQVDQEAGHPDGVLHGRDSHAVHAGSIRAYRIRRSADSGSAIVAVWR